MASPTLAIKYTVKKHHQVKATAKALTLLGYSNDIDLTR